MENCLNSLKEQTNKSFKVILVDYGSHPNYSESINKLSANYKFVKLISCPVSGQLWNKCRAINIALKQTKTPYFLVGDIDLIFHPEFVDRAVEQASNKVIYFMYSFLSEEESLGVKKFEDYNVDFLGGEEITGTTLFPTEKLMSVNGYDEFYHGWGAEDTDIHIRLKQLGLEIEFYDKEVLIKHQWHPKAYRSKLSTSPFHSNLERINSSYMKMTQLNKRIKVNLDFEWGQIPFKNEYIKLSEKPEHIISINPLDFDFSSLLAQLKNFKNEVVKIEIRDVDMKEKAKQLLKRILNRKFSNYLKMERINNAILEEIIKNFRNQPYIYNFNRNKGLINMTILL